TGRIQGVLSVAYAQEARSLLKRLFAKARYLFERFATDVGSIGIAPGDNILCQTGAQARDTSQQRGRSGVYVNAYGVNAVFYNGVKGANQLALVDIVLILANADGLGVDLDQFCQWVLQSTGNRDRATQADVKF